MYHVCSFSKTSILKLILSTSKFPWVSRDLFVQVQTISIAPVPGGFRYIGRGNYGASLDHWMSMGGWEGPKSAATFAMEHPPFVDVRPIVK